MCAKWEFATVKFVCTMSIANLQYLLPGCLRLISAVGPVEIKVLETVRNFKFRI